MIHHIEELKLKLNLATKLKIDLERSLYNARDGERFISKQLETIKAEIEFSKQQLQGLNNQMFQTRHQLSMIEICSASEKSKIDAHVANLELHLKGYQQLFDNERVLFNEHMKEIHEKKLEEEEMQRQKEIEIAEKNELEAKEAAAIMADCDALEKECTVLKKRNNAIMLQLRRKLLKTENARRELAKKNVN